MSTGPDGTGSDGTVPTGRSDEEFREFMRGRWAAMVRLAYGLTGDLGHAEDVAQAAFARAYASWGRVTQAGESAWPSRTARGRPACRSAFTAALYPGSVSKPGWYAYAPSSSSALSTTNCTLQYPDQQVPVAFQGISIGSTYLMVAGVAADVQYLAIVLADGQAVKPIPVTAYGGRFIAYAAPLSDKVVSATAHLQDGQSITAVPFNPPGELPFFGLWAAPGQPVPPTATVLLGSGTANGQDWSVTAYEGPWGTCVTAAGGPDDYSTACQNTARMTALTVFGFGDFGNGMPYDVNGFAPPAATRLAVSLTDGSSFQVAVVTVGNEKLWAFALGKGQAVKSWTAYNASGKPLGTGACSSCQDG